MTLSHEVLLALVYASQISDPEKVRARFIESMNGLGTGHRFVFHEQMPETMPEGRVMPISTLRSSFGYAVVVEGAQPAKSDAAVFRNAFKFLGVLLENRTQARALTSRYESLLKEIRLEKSLVRTVLDTLPVGVWVADMNGTILMSNAADAQIWNDSCSGKNALAVGSGRNIESEEWGIARVIRTGQVISAQEIEIECQDNVRKTILHSAAPLLNERDDIIGAVGVNQDISRRKTAEAALRQSEERFRNLVESISDVIFEVDAEGNVVYISPAGKKIWGGEIRNIVGRNFLEVVHPEDRQLLLERFSELREGIEKPLIYRFVSEDGHVFWGRSHSSPVYINGRFAGARGILMDVTPQKEAEKEKARLQDQLGQARKMESVGRLAGGVAHDFNNMLGVILGHVEMAFEQVDPAAPFYEDLVEIQKAASRSADLTRQLLAFARKQTVAPKVLDLNRTIEGMLKMLRRLIGENIELVWSPGEALWLVKIDPGQIDQMLANLCVNARDAITGVGEVRIETRNTVVSDADCLQNADFSQGEFVLLMVADTGCGVDPGTLPHLFEPFFTTKAQGKGTGLGLATVYGLVRQNNGFISVDSEPGSHTIFKIYLPRHISKAVRLSEELQAGEATCGYETILLVEDEPAILRMTTKMLEKLGYKVLTAARPGEALRAAEAYNGLIDLLMTDVVMPEMNGRDLAKNLLALYPNLRRLFMSGYTADVIAHHGVLDRGVHFIQKPFYKNQLSAKVREALDGGA